MCRYRAGGLGSLVGIVVVLVGVPSCGRGVQSDGFFISFSEAHVSAGIVSAS